MAAQTRPQKNRPRPAIAHSKDILMLGLIAFFLIVFLLAVGFAWLADQPGSLLILKFGGFEFAEENLAVIAAIAFAILLSIIFVWILITLVWKTPSNIGSFFRNKRREKGWRALADGMIAVGAGDINAARKAAKQSAKFLPEEPVTGLLSAQAAQMSGKSHLARLAFEAMLEKPATKVLGLRGLYMEAQATGQSEAARHFVEQAVRERPGLEWSGEALLNMQARDGDWDGALLTLSQNTDARLYDKKQAKRLRAVLLTASALQLESSNPQKAKGKALEAHRLAPELVPAAVISARLLSRLGDLRKATKVIEACWKLEPHPDLMDTYTHVRSGDSGMDRLKRAETLSGLRPNHAEGLMGVARAKMDLQDWDGARATLAALVKAHPSERVCLMMSELEEGHYGDRGRVREWLARAVRAPRDPAWTADGYMANEWAPISPISGALDAFEWRVPVENLRQTQDLALEDIPVGPREIAVSEAAASSDAMAASRTLEKETTEKSSRKGGKLEKSEENGEEKSTLDRKRPPEPTTLTDDSGNILNDEALVLDRPAASADAQIASIDPITKPAIDDPGMKQKEDAAPARKRFKLF